ncbi:MAG: hypothetical protein IT324_07450 [Anaerolineae bacterium]|nr:hypothetical protein [Anaerolineae bacterium]
MSVHIFGVRHHGPGSARSLRQALAALQPDCVLVEGPPDADGLLPLLIHQEMQPPVALLIYAPDQPQVSVYYPFAIFSPEWQALHYALTHNVPARFMDLPQANRLAIMQAPINLTPDPSPQPEESATTESADSPSLLAESGAGGEVNLRLDPLGALAQAAGYSDGERWWEHMVEHRRGDSADLFAGILEAMTALREATPPDPDPIEAMREAYMRESIRTAEKDGAQRIAVVCGAWHAPALANMPPAKPDRALLKGLPKLKVQATWVPWTHGRLSRNSGYGAGIESPGWYYHLWTCRDQIVTRWMTKVSRLLRKKDLDASTAQLIDAVRLAESLAAMRDRPLPGLPELNEAIQSTLCFGNAAPMRLIHDKLIVGELLGHVPDETPMVPLQADLQREQRRLRLPIHVEEHKLDLDLREPTQLDRSHLLHRLNLLGIGWGKRERTNGAKGTFHENWVLRWQPEFAVSVIEASIWGNTVYDAASAYTNDVADHAPDLPTLTRLLDQVLLSDLPDAANHLMTRLQEQAAVASDVSHLMEALPPLANILRYGNVRQTDAGMVSQVIDGLVVRICIGLPGACSSLDDDAAEAMFKRVQSVHGAITLLQNTDHLAAWYAVLTQMIDQQGLHGMLAGRCCRLLFDTHQLDAGEVARRMGLALSTASEPPQAAAWIEGFLKGSGAILIHDQTLWQVLDEWVTSLTAETFNALLPLLRRTFSTFSAPERRQIGERAKRGTMDYPHQADQHAINIDRAKQILPMIGQLLGLRITT